MEAVLDKTRCADHVEALREGVEAALARIALPEEPEELYAPVRYALDGRGKRLRPVLLLLTAEAFGTPPEDALPAALAVEIFHTFTLVHDDIMDHADERRGRPTIHLRWDPDTALLAGDFLMALAYRHLAESNPAHLPLLFQRFSEMVARLCEGQALDKAFETRTDVSVEAYLRMIDAKTGALLQAALEMGAVLGGADASARAALRAAGGHLGRAFQIQDDLLDLVADDARWGKPVGGDLIEGKRAFLLLRALECAEGDEQAWFARIADGGVEPEAVGEARTRMERLGVLAEARAAVVRESDAALESLSLLPATDAAEALRWLVRRMQARAH